MYKVERQEFLWVLLNDIRTVCAMHTDRFLLEELAEKLNGFEQLEMEISELASENSRLKYYEDVYQDELT